MPVAKHCQVRDLDADLSDGQRAELLAFTALAEGHLEAATVYTTWAEPHSFSEYTRVRLCSVGQGVALTRAEGLGPPGLLATGAAALYVAGDMGASLTRASHAGASHTAACHARLRSDFRFHRSLQPQV